MAASESIIPSSMLTSRMLAPPATCWRATASAPSKSSPRISFENFGEPVMLVRSPTTTNPNSGVILSGARPDNSRDIWDELALVPEGIFLGEWPCTVCAINRMCSGVVPQQPPTMFSQPFLVQWASLGERLCGVSGKPVSDNGSGNPALG